MSHKRIHPIDLMSQKQAATCIVDVRTLAEVKAASLGDCLHIPLHELTAERLATEIAASGKNGAHVYVLCQSGRRAELAADALKGQCSGELYVIEGGMNAVIESKIPLAAQGRVMMSLERQVRIAAGLLVLLGAALGTWVNPAFYGLSAFVGAGLTFAGIADICLMGTLIAKAPWNR
jgi:rhodanese-related sulfurtransferase